MTPLPALSNPVHPSVVLFMQMVAYQYENLNGSGYPHGSEEKDVPIAAQIRCMLRTLFDVLTTHHPNRQAWSIPYALIGVREMGK
ncbi:HD domain-containing phosphohydrolase [Vibrio sp. M60_M31a]